MEKKGYVTSLDDLPLDEAERIVLSAVAGRYPFKASKYYLSLIDWSDSKDPIRKIVVPDVQELRQWGRLDASREADYSVLPGLQHKYPATALLLVSQACGGLCRFCFRKRLFMDGAGPADTPDAPLTPRLEYISTQKGLTNILLTGGDSLMQSTARLDKIIGGLREIDHVQIVRLGTKMPAYNPFRILDDPTLPEMISRYSQPDRRIYIMTQFNHPRELTDQAVRAVDTLIGAGAVVANQTPLLRGVNDDPLVLSELFKRLSFMGVSPYYVFICRPTIGNRGFVIPVEEAWDIFLQAQMNCSGVAKRARLVMSHHTGKIEVAGRTGDKVFFRYHRAADLSRIGDFLVCDSKPDAYWFDDYQHPTDLWSTDNPHLCYDQ